MPDFHVKGLQRIQLKLFSPRDENTQVVRVRDRAVLELGCSFSKIRSTYGFTLFLGCESSGLLVESLEDVYLLSPGVSVLPLKNFKLSSLASYSHNFRNMVNGFREMTACIVEAGSFFQVVFVLYALVKCGEILLCLSDSVLQCPVPFQNSANVLVGKLGVCLGFLYISNPLHKSHDC